MSSLLAPVVTFGRAIKFSHSVFALPFALSSLALALRAWPQAAQLAWILVAMVAARSAAMGVNRLVDQTLDARNPRTAQRELPSGRLSRRQMWIFVALAAGVFLLAAEQLNRLCLLLSPVALLVIFGYSFTKRFTALSHIVLGLALGIAPVGAWVAVRGAFALAPLALALAVVAWVAGFDVIYGCQDYDFDRASGLHSLPVRLGIAGALRCARLLHALALALLASVYWLAPLHPLYLGGLSVVGLLLAYEHTLVPAEDLSRVNAAFFTVNGWVSVGYLVTTIVARWLA